MALIWKTEDLDKILGGNCLLLDTGLQESCKRDCGCPLPRGIQDQA